MKYGMRMLLTLLCLMLLCTAALADGGMVSALSSTPMMAIDAAPNQKLALRSGPGTDYTELFSISASQVSDFAIYQQEQTRSTLWGMIEFDSRYGRYRAYTGMKRIDTWGADVPYGNQDGVTCRVGGQAADAYYGPGTDYVKLDKRVPANTKITVFHEESGYVLADFKMSSKSEKTTRAWLPVQALSGYRSCANEKSEKSVAAEIDAIENEIARELEMALAKELGLTK